MPALDFIKSNWETLKNKKVYFYTVGIIPPEAKLSQDMYNSIPAEIRDKIKFIKLPGQISHPKPNIIERLAFKVFIKGNIESKPDKSKLQPIFEFIESLNNFTV